MDGLKQLVDEFSRFARMPALTLKPTDLGRLLESVVVLYRDSHPACRSMRFSLELPRWSVDPDQIKRAVLNLVDNAVEAVGQIGEVTVETAWLPGARRARIIVTDDGPGIAAEDRDKLFVPYFSTKATGMGLGLPIVHQIVTDHGGSIWVEDNPPHGTRFVIELPGERVAAGRRARREHGGRAHPDRGRRAVHPLWHPRVVRATPATSRSRPRAAARRSRSSATRQSTRSSWTLKLGDMDGLEVLRRLRELEPQLPVVMI